MGLVWSNGIRWHIKIFLRPLSNKYTGWTQYWYVFVWCNLQTIGILDYLQEHPSQCSTIKKHNKWRWDRKSISIKASWRVGCSVSSRGYCTWVLDNSSRISKANVIKKLKPYIVGVQSNSRQNVVLRLVNFKHFNHKNLSCHILLWLGLWQHEIMISESYQFPINLYK